MFNLVKTSSEEYLVYSGGIYVSLTPATCAKKSVLVGWKVEFFRQLLYTFNYINVFDEEIQGT
jgi:hypothetical protein